MKQISHQEFRDLLKAQDVSGCEEYVFKCPSCGTFQNANDLIKANAGENLEEVEGYLGFSCVGRFKSGGIGCDWSLGGLLRIHELEVMKEDGTTHAVFVPATPEEAKSHLTRII